jgi:hypothetical protein
MLKRILLLIAIAIASTVSVAVSVTAQDCACGRRGCSGECSSRQEGPRGYLARAECSMTGVVGQARGATPDQATFLAIRDCIRNGGVPRCCEQGATVGY